MKVYKEPVVNKLKQGAKTKFQKKITTFDLNSSRIELAIAHYNYTHILYKRYI